MMCIGDIPSYINTQKRCARERKGLLNASEQAMLEDDDRWICTGATQSITRVKAWFYRLGGINATVRKSNT
jgi:hypothetical protein